MGVNAVRFISRPLFFFQETQVNVGTGDTDLQDVMDLRWKAKKLKGAWSQRELIKTKKVTEVKQNEIITRRSVDYLQEVEKNRICAPC